MIRKRQRKGDPAQKKVHSEVSSVDNRNLFGATHSMDPKQGDISQTPLQSSLPPSLDSSIHPPFLKIGIDKEDISISAPNAGIIGRRFDTDDTENFTNTHPIPFVKRNKRSLHGVTMRTEKLPQLSNEELIQQAKLDLQRTSNMYTELEVDNVLERKTDQRFSLNNNHNHLISDETIRNYPSDTLSARTSEFQSMNASERSRANTTAIRETLNKISTNDPMEDIQVISDFSNNIEVSSQLGQNTEFKVDFSDDAMEIEVNAEEEYQNGKTTFGLPERRNTSTERQFWSRKYENIDETIDLTIDESLNKKNESVINIVEDDPDVIFSKEVIDLTEDSSAIRKSFGFKRKFDLPNKSYIDFQINLHEKQLELQKLYEDEAKKLDLLEEGIEGSMQIVKEGLTPQLSQLNEEYTFYQEQWNYTKELLQAVDFISPQSVKIWDEFLSSKKYITDQLLQSWQKKILNIIDLLDLNSQVNYISDDSFEQLQDHIKNGFGVKHYVNIVEPPQVEVLHIREDLYQQGLNILENIETDFTSIPRICAEYEKWIERYPSSFIDACVPLQRILAPHFRIRLLNWDPLLQPTFSSIDFYEVLAEFGNAPQPTNVLHHFSQDIHDNPFIMDGGTASSEDVMNTSNPHARSSSSFHSLQNTRKASELIENTSYSIENAIKQNSEHSNYIAVLAEQLLESFHELAMENIQSFISYEFDPSSEFHISAMKKLFELNPLMHLSKYKERISSSIQIALETWKEYIPELSTISSQRPQDICINSQNRFIETLCMISRNLFNACWIFYSHSFIDASQCHAMISLLILRLKFISQKLNTNFSSITRFLEFEEISEEWIQLIREKGK